MQGSLAKYLMIAKAVCNVTPGILYGTDSPSDAEGKDGDYYYVRDVDSGDSLYHITAQYYKSGGFWQEITA